MTILLTFRDNIKNFLSRYDFVFVPIGKFIAALIIFYYINLQMGYMPVLTQFSTIAILALVSAFLPVEVMTVIGGFMIVLHSSKISLDVMLACVAIILIFYCGYMRFVSKTGIITLLIPIFYMLKLTYTIPIIMGFMVGPTAVVPVIFGVVLYYYQETIREVIGVLANASETDEVFVGYRYLMDSLINNKTMLLTILVFSCVILVTYLVYRLSFAYSWFVSFVVGGILNVVLFLVGRVKLSVDVDTASVLVGTIIGVLLASLLRFVKDILDYQKTELLQFEDDDYYYYVKAIPKLSVTAANKNVKHINSKTRD